MSEVKTWTVLELIRWTAGFLKQKGIEASRREAEDLLGHVLELDRMKLYLAFETVPSPGEITAFRELVARRAKREPLQYLVGWQPFLNLKIKTDARALIPRPETEHLAQQAIGLLKQAGTGASFADIGCGTGCIALALLDGTEASGTATDIQAEALELAAENAAALGLQSRLQFLNGSGLDPLKAAGISSLDLLISNPPYIPERERQDLQPEVRDYEPASALFAGPEGLAVLEPLALQAASYLKSGAWLMLECAVGQPEALMQRMDQAAWSELKAEKDQFGVQRFLMARRS